MSTPFVHCFWISDWGAVRALSRHRLYGALAPDYAGRKLAHGRLYRVETKCYCDAHGNIARSPHP